MLYLRRSGAPERFDILSSEVSGFSKIVAQGRTELEIRRFFRERAIEQARTAVNTLLQDAQ
jgi:hypothetical protein